MRDSLHGTEGTYQGLRVVTLENNLLKLVILPEAGGKIWQITFTPHAADLLWNNSHIRPAKHNIHTRFDDVWSGGWDELFPSDEEAFINGQQYPDHGETWTGCWDAEVFTNIDEIGVRLTFVTPMSSFQMEKTIVLRRGLARVSFHHRITNIGSTPFPFLWKLHPAFKVTPEHRIDFPPMRVSLEDDFPGTLKGALANFDWPYARMRTSEVDLRRVSDENGRELYFFYGNQMKDGWCALTNTATKLSCGLHFDPSVFPSCWLFASYGGWRNYNVAVLEPCTGYPLNFKAMVSAGRQRTLKPGETLETNVLFVVQEGLNSVIHIDPFGRMFDQTAAPQVYEGE